MPGTPDHLAESAASLLGSIPSPPSLVLVLGSGLGDFAERIPRSFAVDGEQIPHYPRSTVEGHRGRLVFGTLLGVPLMVIQGRVHFYETGEIHSVLYPLLLAHALGARSVVLTNAAGGINRSYSPGDLMLVSDILNLTGESVHTSGVEAEEQQKPMFDPLMRRIALDAAEQMGIRLHSGVYAGVKGPSYETAAEVEMIHRLGGDAVGMSTVLEAQLTHRLGMRTLGISCITNHATGLTPNALSHDEVNEVGQRTRSSFGKLIEGIISRIATTRD